MSKVIYETTPGRYLVERALYMDPPGWAGHEIVGYEPVERFQTRKNAIEHVQYLSLTDTLGQYRVMDTEADE